MLSIHKSISEQDGEVFGCKLDKKKVGIGSGYGINCHIQVVEGTCCGKKLNVFSNCINKLQKAFNNFKTSAVINAHKVSKIHTYQEATVMV